MKIKIWSDYACPFCYIGEKRLKKVLSEIDCEIEIEFKSFELGRRKGIDFKYISTNYTNTFDALRLTKFAQEKNHAEIIEKLFDAYFTKNLELSDHKILKKIAADCGLDENEVEKFLQSEKFSEEVRKDEFEAAKLGVHGVPFFLINDKYFLSGAQSKEILKNAIQDALNEEKSKNFEGMTCGTDFCKF